MEEAIENIKHAIRGCLSALDKDSISANYQLPTANCQLPTANCQPKIIY